MYVKQLAHSRHNGKSSWDTCIFFPIELNNIWIKSWVFAGQKMHAGFDIKLLRFIQGELHTN